MMMLDEPRTATARPAPTTLPRLLPSPTATDLTSHLRHFGPLTVPRDASRLTALLTDAGLRGRGGAGFPTGVKLDAVRRSAARRTVGRNRTPIVVANGTEGEPASRKDVTLLSFGPHLVFDGMVAAALAVGADEAVLCIDRSHPAVWGAVTNALHERAGSDPVLVRVEAAPTHYVTGEESALVHWLNGGEAKPTTTPPRPFERGLAGRPTLIDNVETLAHVALITRFGPGWWRGVGTAESPGSFLATLVDGRHQPRVYELPHGLPLGTLLQHGDVGTCQGVLVGGYFGTWLSPQRAAAVRLDRPGLAAVGAGLGCGAIVSLPADVCPLVETARVARWLAGESAGQCGPCVHGLPAIAGAVEDLVTGDPRGAAEQRLRRWMPMVAGRGACKLPDGAVRFVASALETFAGHLHAHRSGPCPLIGAPPVLPVPSHPRGWR
jgi:NADH:ubiquinone oxidoreductase subunit F (NADH-binding)